MQDQQSTAVAFHGTSGDDLVISDLDSNLIYGEAGNDTIFGGSGSDTLVGGAGNDVIFGGGGQDMLRGGMGDDYLSALGAHKLTGLDGGDGNDTLIGSVPGYGQIHMRGGDGDDLFILDVTNDTVAGDGLFSYQGHHAYGGRGSDRFEFTNTDKVDPGAPVLGRIDDFDASRDSIWIEGEKLDLYDLPEGVDVVEYQGQQWLRIGDNIIYALEGARDGGVEKHFSDMPQDISSLNIVRYVDQVNYVPYSYYESFEDLLNDIISDQSYIFGTDNSDRIYSDALSIPEDPNLANTTIYGGDGNDIIDSGKGADIVYGDNGDDLIAGGADGDNLFGGNGNDIIYGGSENDLIFGGNQHDTIYGGSGDDVVDGGSGRNLVFLDAGNDFFDDNAQSDVNGQDTVNGGGGNDTINGGGGVDLLYGEGGFDRLEGGAGMDTLYGGGQADNLFGQDDDDTLYGEDGLDRLFGGNGNDTLDGGTGPDGLFGEAGNDVIGGGADTDRVFGGAGNDWIDTGGENDTVYGGSGFDTITGGAGNDELWGSFNADTFVFADGFGGDAIMDFNALNTFEKIDLSGVTAIVDLADLLANHASQAGADVVIDDLAGNTITLVGVTIGDLDASDFVF